MPSPGPRPVSLPTRSPFLISWFCWYVRRFQVRKHFHAVRLSRSGPAPEVPATEPLIIVMNHPSWWDPLLGVVASDLFPGRQHYVPIDAAMLLKYPIFGKLGFYGVASTSLASVKRFLDVSHAILSVSGTMLWITAQGRFADVRDRPLHFRPGIGHILSHLQRGWLVPLALEYVYWEESKPEALLRFGEPVPIVAGSSVEQWKRNAEAALTATMDALAGEAIRRDPAAFRILVSGKVGVGGVYDLWRRFRAMLRGETFRPEHGTHETPA